jgi:hypothetical protein
MDLTRLNTSASQPARATPSRLLAILAPVLAGVLAPLLAILGCAVTGGQTTRLANPPTATLSKAPISPTVHQVAQTATPNNPYASHFTASCPQGEIALGGGWTVPQSARVVAAMITGGNTWSVSLAPPPLINSQTAAQTSSPSSAAASAPITIYVECLAGAPGAVVTQRAASDNLPPTAIGAFNDNLGGAISLCNTGETLVGGGFDLGDPAANLELEASWPRDDFLPVQMWVFSLRNYDTVARPITRYAECLSGVAVSASYPHQEGGFLFASQIGGAVVACPTGAALAGGGFQYRMHSPGNARLGSQFSLSATSAGWQGQVLTLSGYGLYALTPLAAAVCLTFSTSGVTPP